MAFEINIEIPELPEFIKALKAEASIRITAVNDALRKCGNILVPAIKSETPKGKHYGPSQRQGKSLRGSTSGRVLTDGYDQVLNITQNARTKDGVSYGIFVREGTVAHDIYPRNAKSLRWFSPERTSIFNSAKSGYKSHGVFMGAIFAKHVHHPGTGNNHYEIRAFESVRGQIEQTVKQVNEDTAARIAAIGK